MTRRPDRPTIPATLSAIALTGVPAIRPGDDLVEITLTVSAECGVALGDNDVLVFAQKIVSKAEGREVGLDDVTPGARAIELAGRSGKDPRLIELILAESDEVLRCVPGVIIVRHRLGFVLANAGIDASNVASREGGDRVLLLPSDPDRTCSRLREGLRVRTGIAPGIVINDSVGRAWRNGTVGTALGVSGLPGLVDLRGRPDMNGRVLQSTEVGLADEVAAIASLVMGQADEGRPIVLIRGVPYDRREGSGQELIRARERDLFP